MIVFDLKCSEGHVFEAWFGSSAGYEEQQAKRLLACPICGDSDVAKAVMAPNVAAKGNRRNPAPASAGRAVQNVGPTPEVVKAAMAMLADAQARMLESSHWVGDRFADRARAMHLGDVPEQPIHGQATREQARELAEEGVPIAPLPFPVAPPESVN